MFAQQPLPQATRRAKRQARGDEYSSAGSRPEVRQKQRKVRQIDISVAVEIAIGERHAARVSKMCEQLRQVGQVHATIAIRIAGDATEDAHEVDVEVVCVIDAYEGPRNEYADLQASDSAENGLEVSALEGDELRIIRLDRGDQLRPNAGGHRSQVRERPRKAGGRCETGEEVHIRRRIVPDPDAVLHHAVRDPVTEEIVPAGVETRLRAQQ